MASAPGWAQLVVSALVGGVVGGGVVAAVDSDDPAAKARPEAAEKAPESDDIDDAPPASSGSPEDRMKQMERRLGVLERRSAAATELRKYATALAKDRADGGSDTNLSPVVDPEDPVFELSVRSVLDKWEQERQQTQRDRFVEMGRRRRERQVDDLTEKLSLTANQKERLADVLRKHDERVRKLFTPPGDGGAADRPVTPGEWRKRMGDIRKDTDRELRAVLDENQQTDYDKLVEDEGDPLGFGWGRR